MKVVIREGHLLAVVTRRLEAMVRANRRIAA